MEQNQPGQDPTTTEQDSTQQGGQEPTSDGTVQDTAAGSQLTLEAATAELKRAREEAAANRVKLRQLEEAQAKREQEEAEKRGEFERLYRESTTKLEQVESELNDLRTFKAQISEREEAERQAVLLKLPEDMRTTFADATKAQLQTILERIAASGASPAANRQPAKAGKPTEGQPPAPKPGEPGWLEWSLQNLN